MGLIHWWPLNGDTKDYGLEPVNLSNSNGAVNNNGKIGKCYFLSHSAGFTGTFNTNALMSGECSFSLWIKIPDAEYRARVNAFSYDSDHILMNSRIFGTSGSYSQTGLCLALQTNNIYSNGSFTGIKLCMGWRDANSASVWDEYASVTLDTWYHVVITKASDRKMCMYVNGTKVAGPTTASAGTFPESNFYINTGGVWGSGNYRNSNAPMYINDFRIYDHALSVKEVKEISKGLILHYNFEDGEIEATTNYIPQEVNFDSWGSYGFGSKGTKTVVSGETPNNMGKFCRVGSSSSSAVTCEMARSYTAPALSQNGQATLSVYVRGVGNTIGRSGFIHVYNSNGTNTESDTVKSFTFTSSWQRISGQYVWNNANASGTTYHCYVCCSMATGDTFEFCEPQFEMKDHVTPWVNGTRNKGTVYDNSGYGYDLDTHVGSLQVLKDSTSGEYSLFSPSGANYVERQNIPLTCLNDTQTFTVNCWVKVLSYVGSSWNTIFRLCADDAKDHQLHFCYNSSGKIILSQYSDDPEYNSGLTINQWAMLSWVHYKDGSSAKCKYYVNGAQIGSEQSYSGLLNIQANPRLTLFYDSIRNGYGSSLYLGDFKMYATALSAADILAEYNRKAAIDRNGNVFTGKIVNNKVSNIKVDKSGFVAGNNFIEGTNVAKFADKYTVLEYLESTTAGQYIDTNYILDFNTKIVSKNMPTADSSFMFWGAKDSAKREYSAYYNGASSGLRPYFNYDGSHATSFYWGAMPINQIYEIEYDVKPTIQIFKLNGQIQTKSFDLSAAGTFDKSLLIFASSQYNATYAYNGPSRCYYLEIYNSSGNLVRHFIPIKRNSDNALGMYELLERKFYGNAGSGTFIAGPELNSLSAIYANQIIEN